MQIESENTPPARILQLCADRGHYETPHLNDILYLHSAGLEDLTTLNLSLYYRLKSLNLSGNHIGKIAGLEYLTSLRTLYLQSNNISRIENLEMLLDLRTLDLSGNRIGRIENLGTLNKLTILNLEHNCIVELDRHQGEELHKLQALTQLNLSRNDWHLADPAAFFAQYTPQIKCLYIQGNQALRSIVNLRQSLVEVLHNLTFLDSRPVQRQTDAVPALSPRRAAAISERRRIALERIDRERGDRFEEVAETTETEMQMYAHRVRIEYGRSGDSTTNDDVTSMSSLEEME